jgi:hypothetical protein
MPAAVSGPPVAVDVTPSPVTGVPAGMTGPACTVSVPVPEGPFAQSIEGAYLPAAMLPGSRTVTASTPSRVAGASGIRAASPSVVPDRVAAVSAARCRPR